MIGVGGFGEYVLSGIQCFDIGIGFEGGFGVVLFVIVLDCLIESFGVKVKKKVKKLIVCVGKVGLSGVVWI